DEIEVEEREKVLELFGENSSVTSYFQDITDNMYKKVFLDKESSNIQVLRNDGETLSANKLSGGTFDQLYLSIRIALGEKLLKDEKGFFITDDPFIKSDSKRLKNQISMLKKIVDYGWQILFFTAKEEVINVFRDDIRENRINYIKLNQL
ncbi:MAG: hypothetical protein SVN78_09040, partial [Deferribacterota bacterium]|nr:hypothetical protein [Deferribacterota bacterium]